MEKQTLRSYMKDHISQGMLLILILLGTSLLFWLYSISWDLYLYMALLWLVSFGIYCFGDYHKYKKKVEMLFNLNQISTLSLNNLEHTDKVIEQLYQQLVEKVLEEEKRVISYGDVKYSEMMEYYTLWAHQIKTPIAAMRILLQADQKEGKTPHGKDLQAELFKIEQYVDMVLQYLRLENMSADLELKEYSIVTIVNQALRKYAKLFIQSGIKVDVALEEMTAITDEKWLQFVIEQLLSNALKYTKHGEIKIYVEQGTILCIKDSGIGIRPEDLPRIFEKGFTGFNGRMDKRSTGIGLYLCKQVLEKLSHSIQVSSQLGKGTIVKIDLAMIPLEVE